jgi:hypothetical protein
VLKKSFWGDDQNFSGSLMPLARGDMGDRFTQDRPRSFVSALRSIVVVEPAKNQFLRDFRRRSIFDFCNTIGTKRTCRAELTMSVDGGKAEVGGKQSNRRD